MINYDTTLKTALEATGLSVFFELACGPTSQKPCITYLQADDEQAETGGTLGYSHIQYYVKVWGDDLSVLKPYCQSIDTIMRGLGFKRLSYNQLSVGQQICEIMLYEGLGKEEFTI